MFWTIVGAVCGALLALWIVGKAIRAGSVHGAAERGDGARVQALIGRAPAALNRLDWEGRSALYWAARYNHPAVVDVLLKAGAAVDAGREWTPLFVAAHHGHGEAVQRLLAKGADANRQDRFGCTPLMEAARYGHGAVVEMLLAGGAEVNRAALEGETALHWAAKSGYPEVARQLLAAGANLEAVYRDGWTPLHYAAGEGNAPVVELLLKAGAQVEAKTQTDGRTPLHRAAKEGQTAAVELLLQHQAEVNVRNAYGKTPLYYTKHFPEIQRLLLARGATL